MILDEPRHLFPLGAARDTGQEDGHDAGGAWPFGLRYATAARVVDVDLAAIRYDRHQQIALIDDGLAAIPAMRHTSTVTKTHTGDRSGPDSDTDATGR